MSFHVIIPARYASSRLPGKPLVDIAGKTMIERVHAGASASGAERVVVATDDPRIVEAVQAFGGEVCLTRADHQSGTDRLQEVAAQLNLADDAIVVNVQGDEPLIPPAVIDQVAANLRAAPEACVATLSEAITQIEDCFNPNAVKVVRDVNSLALYFSRAPIPWHRDSFASDQPQWPALTPQRHIGIYAYRVELLHQFVQWPASALETVERLEQLRVLANGRRIHVAEACRAVPAGVDTEADLQRVRNLFAEVL